MSAHPNRSRSRLAQYGARLRTIDGHKVVEMTDPNDNARHVHQYRRTDGGGLERRVLRSDGNPDNEGSPWIAYRPHELVSLRAMRGQYHPILDPLEL